MQVCHMSHRLLHDIHVVLHAEQLLLHQFLAQLNIGGSVDGGHLCPHFAILASSLVMSARIATVTSVSDLSGIVNCAILPLPNHSSSALIWGGCYYGGQP